MSSPFEISPLWPTHPAAKETQFLVQHDLRQGRHPDPDSKADPDSPELVGAQLRRIESDPDHYWAGYLDDEVVAFIKFDNWPDNYDKQFYSRGERLAHLVQRFNPLAIMGLVAHPKLVEMFGQDTVDELLERLVDRSIDYANQSDQPRSIYVPHYANDPARRATEARGFQWTGKSAILYDLQQDLLLRPAGLTALGEFARDDESSSA